MKIAPKPFEVPPQLVAAQNLPEQASLGAKSKGFAQALENETQIARNPVTPKPLQAPAVVVDLSPSAIAAIEGDAPVKKGGDDPGVRYAFDPLPPVRGEKNEVISEPLPPVEAPGKGKAQNSPAFEARKAVADHPELGDMPFGQVVSLLARGLPLPIDPPPSDGGEEEAPPTDEVGEIPTDTPPTDTPEETTENVPAPAPAPAPSTDSLLTDVEDDLIRTVLA